MNFLQDKKLVDSYWASEFMLVSFWYRDKNLWLFNKQNILASVRNFIDTYVSVALVLGVGKFADSPRLIVC